MNTITDLPTITLTPTGRIVKRSADALVAALADHKTRIARSVDDVEARTLLAHLSDATDSVTVYSQVGFVPNTYKWACPIEVLKAERTDAGWTVSLYRSDAKRSYGNGSLVVVDGRGV